MGFDKRYISEKSIRLIANSDNFEKFYNYFKSDAIVSGDKFSSNILKQIEKFSIKDKNDIIKIMNECKL